MREVIEVVGILDSHPLRVPYALLERITGQPSKVRYLSCYLVVRASYGVWATGEKPGSFLHGEARRRTGNDLDSV